MVLGAVDDRRIRPRHQRPGKSPDGGVERRQHIVSIELRSLLELAADGVNSISRPLSQLKLATRFLNASSYQPADIKMVAASSFRTISAIRASTRRSWSSLIHLRSPATSCCRVARNGSSCAERSLIRARL
ncbi:hypothetical protein [Sphingomonas sp.]|uniref:hypothetical protein n=1 Tax=Sphingomonas sp. TaxID=28214 RepID=UPI0035B3B105